MSPNQLDLARALAMPHREEMLRRDPSVELFWENNRAVLSEAWSEWEDREGHGSSMLEASLIDARLHAVVSEAWADPTTEVAIHDLLDEVAPDVFQLQFFDPERLSILRDYLEEIWDAQIPLRPPYGIVLNRGGAMLDRRSAGYLAAPSFQALYQQILDTYMRPIARLIYPDVMGYDTQTFGFSIAYEPGTDTSIRSHADPAAATLNINMNLPEEDFGGSVVDFFNLTRTQLNSVAFTPGSAIFHRGRALHEAHPITSGSRTNLVLWLYGDNGQIPAPQFDGPAKTAAQRWTTPTATPDSFAPF